MLREVCRHGFERMGAREIVIVTHAENPAARVYRSVGFTREERVPSLSMADRGTRASGVRR
jgi:RimJ/RimL family protein N-acetyltransferase